MLSNDHKNLSRSCVAYRLLFFVVVIVVRTAAVVMVMCIYFYHYEHTSYTLVVSSVISQWCDNDKQDLPEHVIGTVKWRDDVDGNK